MADGIDQVLVVPMAPLGPVVQAGAFDRTPTRASSAGASHRGAVLRSEVFGQIHVCLMADDLDSGIDTAVLDDIVEVWLQSCKHSAALLRRLCVVSAVKDSPVGT